MTVSAKDPGDRLLQLAGESFSAYRQGPQRRPWLIFQARRTNVVAASHVASAGDFVVLVTYLSVHRRQLTPLPGPPGKGEWQGQQQ